MSYTTEKPEPAGHVVVDGVQHAVWKRQDLPLESYEYLDRLAVKTAKLTTDDAIRKSPGLVRDYLRAFVPTLTELPFRGADALRLFGEVLRISNPQMLERARAAAAPASGRAAAQRTSASIPTRSGRRSRTRTGGATAK